MNDTKVFTPYYHVLTGRPVVISTGIDSTGESWGVYYEKRGGSLCRIKNFPLRSCSAECREDVNNYKGRAIELDGVAS